MQQLQPVRLDLEKTLVACKFLDGGAARRQRQTRIGGGLYFFDQILHGRINCGQNGLKARNAARRGIGLVDNWIAGLLEKITHPLIHKSINPIIQFLSAPAGFVTLGARCQSKPILMPR
jgi:hypothetical protein